MSVVDNLPTATLTAVETPRDVHLGPECPDVHEDIRDLVEQYADIFTDLPLRTTLNECEIRLEDDRPVRTRQYPLPHSQVAVIKKEVEMMIDMGVIEKALSPVSSPIVLVKKKSGSVRFCVDFRKLNKQVVFDAEPMPEYLLNKLSRVKYLSKLDLSKGYWPMKSEDKCKPLSLLQRDSFNGVLCRLVSKPRGQYFPE